MEILLDEIKPYFLKADLTDGQLVKNIKSLSKIFNSREGIEGYGSEEELVTAYAAFYLITNAPKLDFLLNQVSTDIKERILKSTFIDFGSGPGTYSFAYKKMGGSGKTILVDKSELMLKQARFILEGICPQEEFVYAKDIRKVSLPRDNKTLFFGNSINEIDKDLLESVLSYVKPNFLIFIEPGTSEVYQKIKGLRSRLFERGFVNHYPCNSNKVECPIASEPKDWCHQILRMQHDPKVERLSQMSQLDRRSMPLIGHIYGFSKEFSSEENQATTFRFLRETKHSIEWLVCLKQKSKLVRFEVSKKTLKKKQIKSLLAASVGEKINFEMIKEVDDSWWRVKLQ